MKNEEKIIELLTDMLIKQDRQEELLAKLVDQQVMTVERQDRQEDLMTKFVDLQGKMVDRQDRQEEILNQHSTLLNRIATILDHQNHRFADVDDINTRLKKVEKQLGL